jgi:hypothetical protein
MSSVLDSWPDIQLKMDLILGFKVYYKEKGKMTKHVKECRLWRESMITGRQWKLAKEI